MKNQDYLYLDHAASTPMRTSALEKYVEAESFGFANSSGGHKLSRDSKNLLEDSREKIAGLFNAAPGEIIFVVQKQTIGQSNLYLNQKSLMIIL